MAPRWNWTAELDDGSGPPMGGTMSKRPRVTRSSKEKWQILQEGLGVNISEVCPPRGIAANLFYQSPKGNLPR